MKSILQIVEISSRFTTINNKIFENTNYFIKLKHQKIKIIKTPKNNFK